MLIEDLRNKVVIVTGASVGIGAGIATAFGASGARVAVHFNRSEREAADVVAEIERVGGSAASFCADLSEHDASERLVDEIAEHFGTVDVLVNNAGSLVRRALLPAMEDALFDEVIDINLRSVVSMMRRTAQIMGPAGGGSIINISSIAARNGGGGGSVLYAAAKAAVATFTRGMAKELAPMQIRVNALSPGVVATRFHEQHTDPVAFDNLVRSVPMARAGTPDDLAGPALFLASDSMSGYVTGQVLEVNGGMLSP